MQKELSRAVAKKVLKIVDKGLVKGIGEQKAGHMCIEAAVCFALGLPHSDNPPCVGAAVRSFKIALNDSAWSSDAARAKGMRKLAIAQLGSDTIDQGAFVKELALETIRKIVPIALRAAASMKYNEKYKDSLEAHAVACESSKDLASGKTAAAAARYAAYAARYAAAAARYAAAAAAAAAAARYADAAAAAAYAAAAAAYAAAAAAYAARYAAGAAAADAADAARDEVLTIMADIGLEALKKCGSPGCQWLDLCD